MFQKDRHQRWQLFSARRGCVNTSPPAIALISNNFASMQGELHNELGIIFFLFSDRICRIHDPSDYLRESSIWRSVAATSTQTQVLSRRGIKPKRKKQIVRHVRRHDELEGHEALHQQQRLHEEQMVQQQWESEREFRAEASLIAVQNSTQLNAEFRMMEYDISSEKDEFHRLQMQEVWGGN